jgi:hypothetical protein
MVKVMVGTHVFGAQGLTESFPQLRPQPVEEPRRGKNES